MASRCANGPGADRTSIILLARHILLRGLLCPLTNHEGSGAPTGARVQRHPLSGRVTYARRRVRGALRSSGNARLSALHRGDCWLRARLGETVGRCTVGGALGSRIGAFARSARSGGRAVLPDASRGLRARQRAGRRIPLCPYDASRRAPSANGTAETIVGDQDSSNESDGYPEWTVGKLSMKSSENGNKRCHINAIRIHIKMTWSSSCERVEEGKRQADCGADRGLRDVEVEDEFCPAHRQQSTNLVVQSACR